MQQPDAREADGAEHDGRDEGERLAVGIPAEGEGDRATSTTICTASTTRIAAILAASRRGRPERRRARGA